MNDSSKESTESWEQLLFNCCFFVYQKNPLPLARLSTTGNGAVLQCLPRAKILPPGPRTTAPWLNWQETGTICTVMHEAPVTNQHGGKSDIMINTFRRRYIGVRVIQKSLPEAAKQTATQTLTPTCNDPKGADKQICIFYVWRIYCCFLKQCSRKNTNYRKPLRSCTHHEEGIQRLTLGQLKPQLGLIKPERTVPQLPAGDQQMEEVYGSNTPNSSACYFYCLLSTRSWFNTNATYKLQHQDLDI